MIKVLNALLTSPFALEINFSDHTQGQRAQVELSKEGLRCANAGEFGHKRCRG